MLLLRFSPALFPSFLFMIDFSKPVAIKEGGKIVKMLVHEQNVSHTQAEGSMRDAGSRVRLQSISISDDNQSTDEPFSSVLHLPLAAHSLS